MLSDDIVQQGYQKFVNTFWATVLNYFLTTGWCKKAEHGFNFGKCTTILMTSIYGEIHNMSA